MDDKYIGLFFTALGIIPALIMPMVLDPFFEGIFSRQAEEATGPLKGLLTLAYFAFTNPLLTVEALLLWGLAVFGAARHALA